jgi:hypothetical protein
MHRRPSRCWTWRTVKAATSDRRSPQEHGQDRAVAEALGGGDVRSQQRLGLLHGKPVPQADTFGRDPLHPRDSVGQLGRLRALQNNIVLLRSNIDTQRRIVRAIFFQHNQAHFDRLYSRIASDASPYGAGTERELYVG